MKFSFMKQIHVISYDDQSYTLIAGCHPIDANGTERSIRLVDDSFKGKIEIILKWWNFGTIF